MAYWFLWSIVCSGLRVWFSCGMTFFVLLAFMGLLCCSVWVVFVFLIMFSLCQLRVG